MNRAVLIAVSVRAVAMLATLGVLPTWGKLRAADEPAVVAHQRDQDVSRLIDELGSDEFVARRRAEKALIRLGFAAFDALKEAENSRDLEIAARAAYLAQLVEVEWVREGDTPRVRAELARYAEMSEDERQATIGRLAALRHNEGLDALCRIVRFEKSQVLSQRAALEVLRPRPLTEGRFEKYAHVIRQAIGHSRRPAAKWLRVYTLSLEDPNAGMEGWDEVIEEEQRMVEKQPDATHHDIMARLLYTVAQIYLVQKHNQRAEKLAQRAFKVREGDPVPHYVLARMLEVRGLTDWAEREYRHLMELVPDGAQKALVADVLAMMLYDRQRALDAAEVLQGVVKTDRSPTAPGRHARMEYYYAEHFAKANDLDKQREHLERAVQADSSDADVLIAMYRLPGADEAYHNRTRALIKATAGKMERVIKQNPRSPTAYNQWAWLISNTEGDFDKAVRYSRRSLELQPNMPGYLDTLGRCYYAKGDYENAVRYQQQAAEFEPYTQTITRQLNFFKKALAESKRKEK